MKPVTQLKHAASVTVWVLQDATTLEIAGKIISNFSDSNVCTTQAWIFSGSLKSYTSMRASCGGGGYDKFNSTICAIMSERFNYEQARDLDAGLIQKWFASHGYIATNIL